jgi:predicted Fe-Mo cluster-binding NifX family protein
MLAIPVMRSRVAPVLDWCSRMQIFPADPSYEGAGQELILSHLEAGQRLKFLKEKGVTTLICGALSAELLQHAEQIGINICCGVAGEVKEVLQSFWQNQLDQPRFWLPGCRGPRRYRGGVPGKGRCCRRHTGSKGQGRK